MDIELGLCARRTDAVARLSGFLYFMFRNFAMPPEAFLLSACACVCMYVCVCVVTVQLVTPHTWCKHTQDTHTGVGVVVYV